MKSLRALVAMLFAGGFVLLAVTVVFGFEEPHATLWVLSAGLITAGMLAVFLHLSFTKLLSPKEKRTWLRLLVGRRAPSAWSEYLTSSDLAASIVSLRASRERP